MQAGKSLMVFDRLYSGAYGVDGSSLDDVAVTHCCYM